jgi:hypothetical protein
MNIKKFAATNIKMAVMLGSVCGDGSCVYYRLSSLEAFANAVTQFV